MRCPYCQQTIRVQGRFCPKCGQQIFGRPVRPPAAPPTAGTPPPPATQAAPPPPRPVAPPLPDLAVNTEVALPAPSAPVGAHAAVGEEIGRTCPYCRFPIKPSEQVMCCPACKVPHHADCWSENQGCTTYGCRGAAAASAPRTFTPSARPSVLSPAGAAGIMPDFATLQAAELSGRATNALVVAIVGLFCCALPGLVGMFMGIGVLSDINRLKVNAPSARGAAIAAILVGIAALLGWLVFVIVWNGGRASS